MAEGRGAKKNDAVSKTVRIMECLCSARGRLSVREIEALTAIPRSTVHRFLLALEEQEWVCRDGGGAQFRPGIRFFLLNRPSAFFEELTAKARRPMKKLMEATGKTAILSVAEGAEGLCIHTEEPPAAVKFVARQGMKIPLDRGATGKVLLAFCPEELRERVLSEGGEGGRAALEACLEEIRRRGYGYSCEEWIPHAADLSVPLMDRRGVFVAQLGIAGLAGTFEGDFGNLLACLRAAAEEIGSQL